MNQHARRRLPRAYRRLALLLTALSSLGPFAIDTYLPSFPAIARDFSVTNMAVQQTLTAYLVPFALMSLWHGALSDALGRRRVIIGGLVLFALASLGCALAPTLGVLLVCRAVQGLTAGASMVVARAVVRDVLDGAAAQKMLSLIALTFALAPAIAPVVGGWLEVWFGWHAVFLFLALLTLAFAAWAQLGLPETLPVAQRRPFTPRHLWQGYRQVFASLPFVLLALATTCNFGGMFIYILGAPRFLMEHLGLGETQFGWLYIPNMLAMMAGSWLSARLAGKRTRWQAIRLAAAIMLAAALLNLLVNLLLAPHPAWCLPPIMLFVLGVALAMPSLTLLGLDLFPQRRGLAASCQAFVQSAGGAVFAAAVVPLVWHTPLTFALGMAVLLLLSCVCTIVAHRRLRPA